MLTTTFRPVVGRWTPLVSSGLKTRLIGCPMLVQLFPSCWLLIIVPISMRLLIIQVSDCALATCRSRYGSKARVNYTLPHGLWWVKACHIMPVADSICNTFYAFRNRGERYSPEEGLEGLKPLAENVVYTVAEGNNANDEKKNQLRTGR